MTGHIAAMTIDGTPVSQADMARLQAEEELHADWRRRTARVVASASRDLDDCRTLLDMLGIDTEVVRSARGPQAPPHPRRPRRGRRAA
ncbi:MAG: hypothetical protein EPN43_11645 [Jatrophihabitans sp.]|nr:MAG: hypothetical protein EPN43_11645 [Jatrophihabitans sp.]